ncbi:Rha family transcriptional regulator [Phocaeicola coprocola]
MPKTNENRVKSNNSTLTFASDHETVNLVTIQNNRAVTSSLQVAEYFGKNHKDVLKAIRELDCSTEFNGRNFAPVKYKDAKGEYRPMYYMTRDGFTYLAMGFTGKIAAQFKEAYIKAFNEMEDTLRTGNFSKYANELLSDAVAKLNKTLHNSIPKGKKEYGPGYGPIGDIQAGLLTCRNMTFEENLKNIFGQLNCVYADAFFFASQLYKKEKALEEYNRALEQVALAIGKVLL